MVGIFRKLLGGGDSNERVVSKMSPLVDRIGSFSDDLAALSDEALAAKTVEFRARLDQGETLDDLLPEAFAVVREAAKRAIGQRHFDVQLIGGMTLHAGKVAEMRTLNRSCSFSLSSRKTRYSP